MDSTKVLVSALKIRPSYKGVPSASQLICGNNNDVIISVAKCLMIYNFLEFG